VKRRLTFTFDNGPWPTATEQVLDFLAARSIKASFFVVGQQLAASGCHALAERARAEGHWIGNHTLTHGAPLGLDGDEARVKREIGETQALLGPLAHARKFFRPNGAGSLGPHLLSSAAVNYLTRDRYTVILWNNVPGDWLVPEVDWVSNALRDLEESEWSTLVLHDKPIAGKMDTLARFYDELMRRDIEVVQEFPPSCILIESGKPRDDLAAFVTGLPGQQAD
jgi:peptidoglycan-N-acetylglucosamine deacetylase